jgi:hypothetical protein
MRGHDRPVGQRRRDQLGQAPDGDVGVELGGELGADLAEQVDPGSGPGGVHPGAVGVLAGLPSRR